jgi:DNA repair protein RadC
MAFTTTERRSHPESDDARLTMRLCAAADVLDIALLDHLIVGPTAATSASMKAARSRRGA